ncbi:MAG: hypothetical protein Q4B61_08110 [Bacteroidales bacterium]|nr:hypothetical protein [Bacteroidales bacterium]
MKKITLSLLVAMVAIVVSAITYTRVKMVDGKIIEYFADKVAKFTYEIDTTTSNKYMYVNTTDGKVDKYNIKDVLEVAYEDQAVSGEKCGHEYVDLGLPSGMLWAVYNVGADSLGEVGDYFAWGETEPKTDYSWSTYKWGSKDSLTKYNSTDSLTALSAEDDAATANWGRAWRTPSMKELDELKNGCTWKWTNNFKESSVAGMVGTSKTNGNTIFLPLSFGYNGTDLTDKVIDGFVWSSDLSTVVNNNGNGYDNGKGVYSGSGYYYRNSYTYLEIAHIDRCVGRCVRAVVSGEDCVKTYNVNFLDIDGKIIESQVVEEGKDAIAPDSIPNVENYKFIGWDKEFTNVQSDLEVAAKYEKLNIKCGHEYVDLGLPSGMLWAVYNVGADSLGEVGDYFAWGETEPKTDYSWSTYKWGSKDSLTKYNSTDSLTALSAEDDAATANWGRAWRTPSMKELDELKNGCTWKWTNNFKESSVAGMVGTSKTNGNTIFLPLSFGYNGTDLTDKVIDGFVWSSDLSTVVNNNGNGYDNGKGVYSGSGYYYRNSYTYLEIAHIDRCVGRCVRAVASGEDCK